MIVLAIGLYARSEFGQQKGAAVTRSSYAFWTLLLGIWSGLNAVALGDDLFNLYVALELLTFAAVPLVCVKGYEATIKAAMRYMLFALIGSVLYLLGTALIYGTYGTLDITLLADRVRPEPAAWTAAALMTVGLLAKTALFPLHLWLPPAHAGAPAPGSAVLSALVVKGSFILIVRIWFDAMPGLLTFTAAQVLATLGAGAVLFGSVLRCGRRVSNCWSLIRPSRRSATSSSYFRSLPAIPGTNWARALRGLAGGFSCSRTLSRRQRCSWRPVLLRKHSGTTGSLNLAASVGRFPLLSLLSAWQACR